MDRTLSLMRGEDEIGPFMRLPMGARACTSSPLTKITAFSSHRVCPREGRGVCVTGGESHHPHTRSIPQRTIKALYLSPFFMVRSPPLAIAVIATSTLSPIFPFSFFPYTLIHLPSTAPLLSTILTVVKCPIIEYKSGLRQSRPWAVGMACHPGQGPSLCPRCRALALIGEEGVCSPPRPSPQTGLEPVIFRLTAERLTNQAPREALVP